MQKLKLMFDFEYADDADSWGIDKCASIDGLKLPAGRHVISLYFHAQLNIGSVTITAK